jgi:hypothetical protein
MTNHPNRGRTNLTTASGEPRIRWNGPDEVTLFDYDHGDDFERRFRVVDGYVREVQNHLTGSLGEWPICDNLSDRNGSRLTATPATLLEVIQREYRNRERARRNGYWD